MLGVQEQYLSCRWWGSWKYIEKKLAFLLALFQCYINLWSWNAMRTDLSVTDDDWSKILMILYMLVDCKYSHWQQCLTFHHAKQALRILEDSMSGFKKIWEEWSLKFDMNWPLMAEFYEGTYAISPHHWWPNLLCKTDMTPPSAPQVLRSARAGLCSSEDPFGEVQSPYNVQSPARCLWYFLFIYYVHYFYMFHVLYKLYITVTENQSDWSKCSWNLSYLMFLELLSMLIKPSSSYPSALNSDHPAPGPVQHGCVCCDSAKNRFIYMLTLIVCVASTNRHASPCLTPVFVLHS